MESGDVAGETITSWKERIPELLRGIQPRMYGTKTKLGVFSVLCQSKVLGGRVQNAKGGKSLNRG